MRTVKRHRIVNWEAHEQRMVESLHLPGMTSSLDDCMRGLCRSAMSACPWPNEVELKLTLVLVPPYESLKGWIYMEPLHEVIRPEGVEVQVTGSPRADAHTKSIQWVRERQQLQQLGVHEDGNEVDIHEWILVEPQSGDLFEGHSSNFFVIQKDGSVFTAPLDRVLPGTIQKIVVDQVCPRLRIPICYQCPNLKELGSWRAAFLTSTSRWAVPISSLHYEEQSKNESVSVWKTHDLDPKDPLLLSIQQELHALLFQASTRILGATEEGCFDPTS